VSVNFYSDHCLILRFVNAPSVDSRLSVAAKLERMKEANRVANPRPADVSTLRADLAFFGARLALTRGAADTSYQRAQYKVFSILGGEIERRLSQLDAQAGAASQRRKDV
jgi:hypothetical protein